MEQQRRHFSGEEKVKILREHLIDKVPISQVCEKYKIQPTLFYSWQKTFFENGTAAFERQPSHSRVSVEQKKIDQLEQKLQRKDEVLAELMTEHIMLKKVLGRLEAQMGRARCAR
jgi:transposase-like protein